MPVKQQITQHCCIQGWSAFAEWTGVPLAEILKRCKVLPQARHLIFHSHQVDEQGREYYGSLDIEEAKHPQTILAYEMNGAPLLMNHGAPLRLYSPVKLGYKNVKYLTEVNFLPHRSGGYWEDQGYDWYAGV